MNRACLSVIAFAVLFVGCSRSNPSEPIPNHNQRLSLTPPFSTKEPNSYQATRIITVSETNDTANEARVTKVWLARDGVSRREEYEAGALGSIVYLETGAGRFVLLTQPKLYAKTDEVEANTEAQLTVETEMMSPDYLLNETNSSAQYEKLGTEMIAGRTATKYRVTPSSSTKAESFIWIDETLGMPIASQSTSTDVGNTKRVSMELRDVRTEVDSSIFALPVDYRQVTASQIRDMMSGVKE